LNNFLRGKTYTRGNRVSLVTFSQVGISTRENLISNLADCIRVECLSISRIERLAGIKWSDETGGKKYSTKDGNELSSAYESRFLKPIFRTTEKVEVERVREENIEKQLEISFDQCHRMASRMCFDRAES
jgi:hypothetical protein